MKKPINFADMIVPTTEMVNSLANSRCLEDLAKEWQLAGNLSQVIKNVFMQIPGGLKVAQDNLLHYLLNWYWNDYGNVFGRYELLSCLSDYGSYRTARKLRSHRNDLSKTFARVEEPLSTVLHAKAVHAMAYVYFWSPSRLLNMRNLITHLRNRARFPSYGRVNVACAFVAQASMYGYTKDKLETIEEPYNHWMTRLPVIWCLLVNCTAGNRPATKEDISICKYVWNLGVAARLTHHPIDGWEVPCGDSLFEDKVGAVLNYPHGLLPRGYEEYYIAWKQVMKDAKMIERNPGTRNDADMPPAKLYRKPSST